MYKITLLLLFVTLSVFAQNTSSYKTLDSLSYNYYLNGRWDDLIEIGKQSKNQKIDFKYLQQRVGYAYFMKNDFHKAIQHYSKSLEFDKNDEVSHIYLYYSALNIADESMALYHLSKLSKETKESLNAQPFKPISAIDLEYNYKTNNILTRSNPNYIRIGLNSNLGYRLNLYQSISRYNQTTDFLNVIQQNEYFGILSYSLFERTNLSIAYHYANTKVTIDPDTYYYPGHIFLGKINHRISRFDFSLNTSFFNSEFAKSTQIGMEIGYLIPSALNLYLKSSLYNLNDSTDNRLVFSQKIGFSPFRTVWLEAALTLGNLNNYVDANGLYFYNSVDPTLFRSGFSAFWNMNKHLTIYSNYTFDKKTVISTLEDYQQHSITGGIIWKI